MSTGVEKTPPGDRHIMSEGLSAAYDGRAGERQRKLTTLSAKHARSRENAATRFLMTGRLLLDAHTINSWEGRATRRRCLHITLLGISFVLYGKDASRLQEQHAH